MLHVKSFVGAKDLPYLRAGDFHDSTRCMKMRRSLRVPAMASRVRHLLRPRVAGELGAVAPAVAAGLGRAAAYQDRHRTGADLALMPAGAFPGAAITDIAGTAAGLALVGYEYVAVRRPRTG